MQKEVHRWTATRKAELLLQLIKGETKLVGAIARVLPTISHGGPAL